MVAKLAKRLDDIEPGFIRAVIGELLLTFLFVFTTVSAAMAAEKMSGGKNPISELLATALANTFAVATIVSAGVHISGAHLNPAVTLVMAVGGRVSVLRFVLYVIVQLLASALACLLLRFLSGGLEVPVHALASGVGYFRGMGMEMVLTFSLLFSIYATMVEPRDDTVAGLGPLLVGLMVGANTLAGGIFTGASMNPARSFGPALVSWRWTNHWVYWVGPIFGGFFAGFIYERFLITRRSYAALPDAVDEV